MGILLRNESAADYRQVEELTREAFWNQHVPGCDEHYLVHVMRQSEAFVKELDFVAVYQGEIIGNIMYTKAFVLRDDGEKYPVLCFGPISVLPEYQGRGIGSKLIEHSKEVAIYLGYTAILILGDPEFYKRVGFVPAESYEIGTSWDAYATPLLACELVPGALQGCKGRFFEDAVYDIDKESAEAFDKIFISKEKISGLPSQTRFLELTKMNRPRVQES